MYTLTYWLEATKQQQDYPTQLEAENSGLMQANKGAYLEKLSHQNKTLMDRQDWLERMDGVESYSYQPE
jgi:hypothetical protein